MMSSNRATENLTIVPDWYIAPQPKKVTSIAIRFMSRISWTTSYVTRVREPIL